MDFIASYIDIYDYNLQVAILSIIVAPIVWNILARIEYYTHLLTKLACGNKYWGCYGLALYIFSFSLFRDYLVERATASQPKLPLLGQPAFLILGYALMAIGFTFVLSSMYKLGITGTYLGDYFGILMEERVTSFPFNVLDNPMYVGSTMAFFGNALRNQSPAGLVMGVIVYIMYKLALLFEEPFTAYIYSQRKKTPAKRKSKKVD